jgi:hypothetical protein
VLPVGVALGQQFGLQLNDVAVFGVHHRDATEFGQPAERYASCRHSPSTRQAVFERVDAAILMTDSISSTPVHHVTAMWNE